MVRRLLRRDSTRRGYSILWSSLTGAHVLVFELAFLAWRVNFDLELVRLKTCRSEPEDREATTAHPNCEM